jgi:hypothetical protein
MLLFRRSGAVKIRRQLSADYGRIKTPASAVNTPGAWPISCEENDVTDRICDVVDCGSPAAVRGWCHRHYSRWKRHGDPLAGRRSHLDPMPTCAVPGCSLATPRIVLGLCETHYARQRRTGHAGEPGLRRINGEDEQRFWAFVDREGPLSTYRPDLGPCWLFTGCTDTKGYGSFRHAGGNYRAHRFAYELLVGPIPEGLQIDHLCRVLVCVNPRHLEPVTNDENQRRGAEARRAHLPVGA